MHDIFHQRVWPALLQCDHQVTTRQNANDACIVQHRKVLLRRRQYQLDRSLMGILRSELAKVVFLLSLKSKSQFVDALKPFLHF